MSKEIDYQAWMQSNPPKQGKLLGKKDREARRAGRLKRMIRLDAELIEEFKKMAGERGYESLMEQALRAWLINQGVTDLLRAELGEIVNEVFEEAQKKERAKP